MTNSDTAREGNRVLRWRGCLGPHRFAKPAERHRKVARFCRELLRLEGASVVELALSVSILFALLIGMIELSVGLYASHATADIARQATRWAMVRGSTSCINTPNLSECGATSAQIKSYAASVGYLNLTTSDVNVSWETASTSKPTTWSSCTGTCNAPGDLVVVTVTYPFSLGIPFVPKNLINISSTSRVVIAQ